METVALKDFCAQNEVSGISPVRTNANNYPFVTLLSPKFEGGATNVYFGKKSSESVTEGMTAKEAGLAKALVVTTTNGAGEERLKISLGADYTDVNDLFE